MATNEPYVTPEQFAAMLGRPKKYLELVLHLMSTGEIPSVVIADQPFIPKSSVESYLNSREAATIDGAMFTPYSVIQRFFPAISQWAETISKSMPVAPLIFDISINDSEESLVLGSVAIDTITTIANDPDITLEDAEKFERLLETLIKAKKLAITHWRTHGSTNRSDA